MSSALDKLAARKVAAPVTGERVLEIPLTKIRFDPAQPRKAFHTIDGSVTEADAAALTELAESIDDNGLIENITVQEMPDGTYIVVVGERRTRAHLQLGRATIKAVIRNDLTNRAQRLLYQLAENVNRENLTDAELAASIRDLMKGSDTVAPMSQVQIAKHLGKSEGWVSRFVKFGDEELQRLWVKTGIADTVEKLYRLSILPKSAQVDILRRVELPEDDPEFLQKPLLRDVIDALSREAKIGKMGVKQQAIGTADAAPVVSPPASHAGAASTPHEPREYGVTDGAAIDEAEGDPIAQGLAALVVEAHSQESASDQVPVVKPVSDKYQLPESARAAILGMAATVPDDSNGGSETREVIAPPVNCRVSIANIVALLEALKANEDALSAIEGVRCELNIPGPLAQLISNQLTGIIVDRKQVPAILQIELAKLQ